MIIQCVKCSTKYRFDDNLMEGDGVWVRCSRCGHEFFQENTFARSLPAVDEEAVLKRFDEIRGEAREREAEELPFDDLPASGPEESIIREGSGGGRPDAGERKGRGRKALRVLILAVLLVVLAGTGLWSYMRFGGLDMKDLRASVASIPYLDQLIPLEDPGVVKLSQIRVVNLRQRYVRHWILGDVLVVEGTAWNSTPFPVARVRVQARFFDGEGKELAREEAFAGNLLTDTELITFPDENLKRELARSQGSDVSNDRIEPRGEIPFMIVYSGDCAMVKRTTVHVSGVEKLLTPR